MNNPDPEFEEFLKRRRPLFRREVDDGLEPPAELDRIVLRQAREAIEGDRPMRVYRAPRWAAPVAIAATLVLGMSIVFKAGMPQLEKVPEVTVENVAQRVDYPAAAEVSAAPAPESAASDGPVVVDLASPKVASREAASAPAPALAADNAGDFVSKEEGQRYAAPPPPAPPMVARGEVAKSARTGAPMETAGASAAAAPMSADAPAWRRDPKSWQAEIERLRASGDNAQADAELAEYNRQHRAFAVAPDR